MVKYIGAIIKNGRYLKLASIYLRQVDFHTPETEEEIEEIQKFQHRYMTKIWVKRLIISFVLVGIFVTFQLIARVTVPYMFGREETVERLLRLSIYVFMGFNILSWGQLMFECRVLFDINKAKIAKFQVKKKMVINVDRFIPVRIRYLVCEKDGSFVVDRVYIRGMIAFSNVKEGQTIYVERIHDDGHYQYYYVA